MPEYDSLTSFHKSGLNRLRDAEHLLTTPEVDIHEQGVLSRHMRGAMYLSGYGVECQLKAYLISQHPPYESLSDVLIELRKKDPTIRDICGSAGHDLEYLLILTKLASKFDSKMMMNWNKCKKWKSTWRYDPTPEERTNAEDMIVAARAIVMWIRAHI